VMKLRLAK